MLVRCFAGVCVIEGCGLTGLAFLAAVAACAGGAAGFAASDAAGERRFLGWWTALGLVRAGRCAAAVPGFAAPSWPAPTATAIPAPLIAATTASAAARRGVR